MKPTSLHRRKKHSSRKKIICAVALVLIFLATVTTWASFFMLNYSLKPTRTSAEKAYRDVFNQEPDAKPWIDSLKRNEEIIDTFINVRGERRHAIIIKAPVKTNKVAVLVHGYNYCAVGMLGIGYMYNQKLGYNIVLPDLYAHGCTDGNHINMGWNDRNDVILWIKIADKLFADSSGHSQIVVHGVSMGAATTMCVSGEKDGAAPFIKCYVEDCGYTSVWDEFREQLKQQFGMPEFPLLYTTSELCKLRYGWTFQEASPIKQLRKCHKPMLFIHGDNDTFVPTHMVYELYAAKSQPKSLYVAKGSAHAKSYNDHRDEYHRVVKAFVSKYIH